METPGRYPPVFWRAAWMLSSSAATLMRARDPQARLAAENPDPGRSGLIMIRVKSLRDLPDLGDALAAAEAWARMPWVLSSPPAPDRINPDAGPRKSSWTSCRRLSCGWGSFLNADLEQMIEIIR